MQIDSISSNLQGWFHNPLEACNYCDSTLQAALVYLKHICDLLQVHTFVQVSTFLTGVFNTFTIFSKE